ncbi:MAG: tRNA (N(6)-L-threonylcarbamoyladenosine(37)-C(2))-methylthiotransferase MtaB [Deltaproteobacteria bacterium]|nr:tRNA (N(6)-L-threonylcarbamoyladenosine(37)-C(2))-methylthiotransferase MtaB [Deltaproteobacteria bacterium]
MSDKCHVATFGCRVNQADTEGILSTLVERGLVPSDSPRDAEVVVINSCTVTHRSDADVRKLVHRIQRENPTAKVIIAGCLAQRDPEALVGLPGVAAVVGQSHAHRLGEIVDRLRALPGADDSTPLVARTAMDALDVEDLPPVEPVAMVHDRTRPFVKIQDGCDAACTYCVIPAVRGPARSAPIDRVVASVERLVAQGYFEVVIAGVHLGTYGRREPGRDLTALVQRLLGVPGLGRLRLSAIEPMAFPATLIDLAAADARLAPHFHLPLQSGCDRVLKRMSRPYRTEDFDRLTREIRAALPDACLGTDVITGFPGESEQDFEETLAFVSASALDYVHVFSYSDRPGVPSTRLRDKVSPGAIKSRTTRLIERSRRLWTAFLDRQVGCTLEAVTLEQDPAEGAPLQALSASYCPIRCEASGVTPGINARFRILRRDGAVVWGELA